MSDSTINPFNNPETRSKAGKARAANLSPERRREIAKYAGLAKGGHKNVPTASHVGELKIGDTLITCAVVDGKRYLSKTALDKAFGNKNKGKISKSVCLSLEEKEGAGFLPGFLKRENLFRLISNDLCRKIGTPTFFLWKGTKSLTTGYEAELLPDICSLILDAKDLGILSENQKEMAKQAHAISKGLMKVGIIALVDEVTGYQEFRDRDELTKLLDKYISAELQPWTKKFHPEFFKEIYRLYGWKWGQFKNHPQCVGNFINEIVYQKMPQGVLEELKNKNPCNEDGSREHKHHQFLTPIGNEHLGKHLAIVTTLMRMSRGKGDFKLMFERAFPGEQLLLDI